MRFINPRYKPHRELGFTEADWDLLKSKISDYLDTAPMVLSVDEIRSIDARLKDPRVWAQLANDLGLALVP
jgi:hypothetical protein